jgi:opacity protein-like surface antigen
VWCSAALLFAVAGSQCIASAIDEESAEESFVRRFSYGEFEVAVTSGALFSPLYVSTRRPSIYYTESAIQLGYMVSDVHSHNFLRGNFELTGELFGGAIFRDHGNYVSGCTVWFRRNFVRDGWRLVPYAQIGVGLTFTDADRILLGQTFNFNLDAGIGTRYFISRNVSINVEYRYQHISNANQARHNLGINGQGGILGVSFFF